MMLPSDVPGCCSCCYAKYLVVTSHNGFTEAITRYQRDQSLERFG